MPYFQLDLLIMKLQKHLFLSFFSAETAERLMQSAERSSLEKDAVLIHDGDDSKYLYLILEGTASIRKQDEHGEVVLLGYVEENDFVGEFGIIDNSPRSADVVAVTEMQVAAIPRELVLESLRDEQALFRVAAHTIRRMRTANQRHVQDLLQQERMSLLGKMVSGIIHDFRNPFAVIGMATELIQMKSSETDRYCQMILEQIERVNSMAEDTLDFAGGNTTLNAVPIVIGDLFERFCKQYAEYYSQWNISIQFEPSQDLIEGDADKLMRVLQNLIGNAAQAMQQTGGSIRLSSERKDDKMVLIVRDDGPGIPEEIQHNLFDAFSTFGKVKGVGLGLVVTRNIINNHGGEISFDSEPGRGTTFKISLPAPSA